MSREFTHGKFTDKAKKIYLEHINLFQEQGAEGVITGFTELPVLLDQEDMKFTLIATTQLNARLAADSILQNQA